MRMQFSLLAFCLLILTFAREVESICTSYPTCPSDQCPVIPSSLPQVHLTHAIIITYMDYGDCDAYPPSSPGEAYGGINVTHNEACACAGSVNGSTPSANAGIGFAFLSMPSSTTYTLIEIQGLIEGECWVSLGGRATELLHFEVWTLDSNNRLKSQIFQQQLKFFSQVGAGTKVFSESFSGSVNLYLQPNERYLVWAKNSTFATSSNGTCAQAQAHKIVYSITLTPSIPHQTPSMSDIGRLILISVILMLATFFLLGKHLVLFGTKH